MSKRESKSVEMFRLVEELESSGRDRQVFASQHGISLSNRTAEAARLLATPLSSPKSGVAFRLY